MNGLLRYTALALLCWGFVVGCSNGNNNNTSSNRCKKNSDCSSEQNCADGKCKAIKCSKNSDCRNSYTCDTGASKCIKPVDCPEKDKGGCCEDKHCKVDQICKEKKCESKPPVKCKEDKDCTDSNKPKCVTETCVSVEFCKTDKDCKDATKSACKDSTCVARGLAKLDDPCDKVACEKDLICWADVGKPHCLTACDPFNAVCLTGTVCAFIGAGKGVCRSRNNGKREGESCVTKLCERNLFCVDWPSGSSTCARPCRADKKDCSSSELCYNFGNVHLCVPKPPLCGTGRPCVGTSWKCDEKQGYCLPQQCPQKACPGSQLCRLGSCNDANCCKGDVCPKGNVCNHSNGKCVELNIRVPFCTSCLGSGTCASPNQRCIKLSDDNDKFCAEECTATRTCADADYECQEQSDKRWFCLPSAGTCQRNRCDGVKCKEGEACLPATKKCVPIGLSVCKACSTDVQCGGPTDRCIIPKGAKSGVCGLDCSGCTTCPRGYACQAFGDKIKQCVPTSGKCP